MKTKEEIEEQKKHIEEKLEELKSEAFKRGVTKSTWSGYYTSVQVYTAELSTLNWILGEKPF